MFGYVELAAGRSKDDRKPGPMTVGGVRFTRVCVAVGRHTPAWLLERRCAFAAKQLRRAGATRAVFPEEFPYQGLFARWGVEPVAALPLYRELAPELVRRAMEDRALTPSGAVIAVVGDRLSADLTRIVTALCLRNRYVTLDVPAGGEELGRSLRRSLGVPLVVTSSAEQLERADVLVLLAERPALTLRNPVVLALYDEAVLPPLPRLTLPEKLAEQLPTGGCRTQLLSALWDAGALRGDLVKCAANADDA